MVMISSMVDGFGMVMVINLVLSRVVIISNLHRLGVMNVSRGFVLIRLDLIGLDLTFVLDIGDESGFSIDVVSHHQTATIREINEVASLGAVSLTALFSSVVVVIVLDGVVVLVVSRSLQR